MSIFEILVIMMVALFVIKPEDIPKIIRKVREIRCFILNTKQEILEHLDPEINSNELVPLSNDVERQIEQINYYLSKISSLGEEYQGEYSLELVKKYYNKLLKNT